MKTNLKRIIACIEVHIENSRLLGYHGLRRGYEESLRMIKDFEASLHSRCKNCLFENTKTFCTPLCKSKLTPKEILGDV